MNSVNHTRFKTSLTPAAAKFRNEAVKKSPAGPIDPGKVQGKKVSEIKQ